MLRELTIENVAVIEKAVVNFESGFNVLTGETGAGKSILIDSINAILGNRTSRDIVRAGASKARIWAVFTQLPAVLNARLEEDGYPCEEGELLLYREISAEGKSTCRINGRPAPAASLREICEELIAIHGQHDNQSLLNPARHLGLLDAYAKNAGLLAAYQTPFRALVAIEKELKALTTDEREKQAKIELLRYQIDEIEAAALQPGEEEVLAARRSRMQHAQKIVDGLTAALRALDGDPDDGGGALDKLSAAGDETADLVRFDPELEDLAARLQEVYYSAQELASELWDRLDAMDMDPQELEQLEERLDLFYRLKQKYGSTAQQILDFAENARHELEKIEFSDEYMEKLYARREALLDQVLQAADALTQSRLSAFEQLRQQLQSSLAYLNMAGVEFSLRHSRGALTSTGRDSVELYIVTNRGEQPKPLAKIASGGELSRIMLALKNALADSDALGTVIYDEIDTGVSGLAAGRIGSVMQQTAGSGRQVICVTHTAQIAAAADNHLLIQKQVQGERTYTQVHTLDRPGRVEELARIIAGNYITDLSRASADEMLLHFARGGAKQA